MSYHFTHVKRYKRGAAWPDGNSRLCTRCGYEQRQRRRVAIITAFLKYTGSKTKVPVGYCEEHVPGELEGENR